MEQKFLTSISLDVLALAPARKIIPTSSGFQNPATRRSAQQVFHGGVDLTLEQHAHHVNVSFTYHEEREQLNEVIFISCLFHLD